MKQPSLPKLQHIIASGLIVAVGGWVTWVSFTEQPSEAFLFPRLISTVFFVLSTWTFVKATLGWTKIGNGISTKDFMRLLPGLLIAIVYVFWAAKTFGFYTAGTVAFFVLLSLYDPASHNELKTWGKRALITAGFLTVMYGLFAKLLKVYTPREIFF